MFTRPTPTVFPTHAGRVAVVTGAGRGIGQSFCHRLAERGAIVVGVDIGSLDETAAIVKAAGAKFMPIAADISSQTETASLGAKVAAEFGRCDILINNAAIFDPVVWDDLDFDRWRSIHAVCLDGPFLMAKALVPLMTENSYGRIVNVVSTSFNMALPIYVAYRSAKMGLVGLTRALASLGDRGITANCVSPTLTRTPGAVEANSANLPLFDIVRNMQSIKVDSVPDDIAHTVMFLTSKESYWVTGQGLSVDGGMQFGMP